MSTAAQRTIRLAVQTVVATYTGVPVVSPGDWETPTGNLPEIKLRCTGNRKTSEGRQSAGFTTVVQLEMLLRVSADTASSAQDAIEALMAQVEDCVLALPSLLAVLQQVATVDTQTSITADGRTHIGEARMSFGCETLEVFDPVDIYGSLFIDLQQLVINLDTINPFDAGNAAEGPMTVSSNVGDGLLVAEGAATGTYPNPPFPDSVVPAPRTQGPDGRNEATLNIDFT